jgi:hypothetical protein
MRRAHFVQIKEEPSHLFYVLMDDIMSFNYHTDSQGHRSATITYLTGKIVTLYDEHADRFHGAFVLCHTTHCHDASGHARR